MAVAIMATLNFEGLDELLDAFLHISKVPDDVVFEALTQMEDIIVPQVKAIGESYGIRDPESDVHILDKIKKGKPKRTKDGGIAKVSFSGSRTRNGKKTSNSYIAFVNEYGKRNQQARPFVSEALDRNSEKMVKVAARIIGGWIEENFK